MLMARRKGQGHNMQAELCRLMAKAKSTPYWRALINEDAEEALINEGVEKQTFDALSQGTQDFLNKCLKSQEVLNSLFPNADPLFLTDGQKGH
jgi:hypothetical protein